MLAWIVDALSVWVVATVSAEDVLPVLPGVNILRTVVWGFALAQWIGVVRELTAAQRARAGASWSGAERL